MNHEAERHVAKARDYLARGDEYHRRAKREIEKAISAGATQREVARALARSHTWVQAVIAWDGEGTVYGHDATARVERRTRAMLRDAPLEQVEQVIASLPRERQQAIAAAAGHGYLKARQEHDEAVARRTPAEQREIDDAKERLTRPGRRAVGIFSSLNIVQHVEQATDDLRELTADASLSEEGVRQIRHAVTALVDALEFAEALVGGRAES